MKIVLIHGQNHTGSSCHIGRLLAEQFPKREITEFFLPRDLEHFCLGCYRCIENEAKCPFYTEKNHIMEEVEQAELLIFTTPTYCLRASAPMKSFIDLTFTYWMSHKPRKAMFRKKAVVISTAAGAGTGSAIKDITTALQYWGIPYIKSYGISLQAMNWEGVSEKKKCEIQATAKKLAKKVSTQKADAKIKTKCLFYLMRFMQNAGLGSSPTEKAYWEAMGWLDKTRPWKTH